jgi:hypothetical protein
MSFLFDMLVDDNDQIMVVCFESDLEAKHAKQKISTVKEGTDTSFHTCEHKETICTLSPSFVIDQQVVFTHVL